jgi:hypothetical protein
MRDWHGRQRDSEAAGDFPQSKRRTSNKSCVHPLRSKKLKKCCIVNNMSGGLASANRTETHTTTAVYYWVSVAISDKGSPLTNPPRLHTLFYYYRHSGYIFKSRVLIFNFKQHGTAPPPALQRRATSDQPALRLPLMATRG